MKIVICGAGAIGSNLTRYLVPDLHGNHEITVLDRDVIEERNVTAGTQFYTSDQIGDKKVEALQFNIYRQFEREIAILFAHLERERNLDAEFSYLKGFDLIIDCFDNHDGRRLITDYCKTYGIPCLHIGFSDQFTFAIEWNQNYQVPADITSGFDICEMQGAAAFVNKVASLGALVVEQFIDKRIKTEIVGGKFDHRTIK